MNFALILSLFSCHNPKNEEVKEFDWLLGDWQRLNNEDGSITYENWTKSRSIYSGFGYTIKKKDTIWQEKVTLSKDEESWSFDVLGENEKIPTKFSLINSENQKFIVENPTNEFPTKIEYWKEENQLKARVSNDEMSIEFMFEKRK